MVKLKEFFTRQEAMAWVDSMPEPYFSDCLIRKEWGKFIVYLPTKGGE